MKCLWCGKLFDPVMASCGTGTTWSIYLCPHCGKPTADGSIIPTVVKNDPEIKIREEHSSRPLLALGYKAPLHRVDKPIGFVTMPIIKGGKMKTKYRKKVDELERRVKALETDTISAHRIIVGHRSPHVVTGQEFSVQQFANLLLDELNLTIVRSPTSFKIEKTAGKGGPGCKPIKGE